MLLMNDQQAWLRRLLVFAVCAAVGMVLFLMFAALSEILGRQQELDEKLMDLDQRIQKTGAGIGRGMDLSPVRNHSFHESGYLRLRCQ